MNAAAAKTAPKKSGSEMVREYFKEHPNATNKEIAEATGVNPAQVSQVLKKLRGDAPSGKAKKSAGVDTLKSAAALIEEFGNVAKIKTALETAKMIEKAGGSQTVESILASLETLKGKI